MTDKIIEELEKLKIKIKTVNGFLSQKQGFYNSVIEKSIEIVKKHEDDGWRLCSEELPPTPSDFLLQKEYLVETEVGTHIVLQYAGGWNCTVWDGKVNRDSEITGIVAWTEIKPYKRRKYDVG